MRHTLSIRDEAMTLSVLDVAHPVSLTASPLPRRTPLPEVTRASLPAPSWSAHIRRLGLALGGAPVVSQK